MNSCVRAWENYYHRVLTAEAHMKHMQFREESRYPGFYYRMDKNFVDEKNWKCFVTSVYHKKSHEWTVFKRKHVDLVDKAKLFKAAAHYSRSSNVVIAGRLFSTRGARFFFTGEI